MLLALAITGAAGQASAHEAIAVAAPKPAPSAASTTSPESLVFGLDQEAAVRSSQAALGGLPGDYLLLDQQERPVHLVQFRGKPLLVNFIYTGCVHVCPTSSRALRKAVDAMRERFGVDQFNVVSIGFNPPSDSPLALRAFAAQQRIDDPNWAFLSPRAADVALLAGDFGFSFVATPMGFDHTLQVSIVDASGRIYRQVYGDDFSADALGEPLRQLVTGALLVESTSWSDLFDRVRILCSVYDPRTGKYRVNYTMYLELAGGLTFFLAMLVFALSEWRRWRAARRQRAA